MFIWYIATAAEIIMNYKEIWLSNENMTIKILEVTRRYAGFLLAPAVGFGLRLRLLSFGFWLSHPLVQISLIHCQSQTRRPEILKECSSHTMCHVSHVMCHMSRVTCHMSHVKCQKKKKKKKIMRKKKKKNILQKKLDKVVELVGGGSVINGAYPV